MKYRVFATDYDGTIAFDGHVDGATIDALQRARDAGAILLLVTGRELADLFNTFDRTDIFHRIVAENGAVLYDPSSGQIDALSSGPPSALIERLNRQQVPLSVGHSVIATVEPHAQAVMSAIHDLGLDWHIIFNKGSVMALPSDVTKATGLRTALETLQLSPQATIGVGDAENDLVFLRCCGLAAAVANALPTVKVMADVVTEGARGTGVIELLKRWLDGELDVVPLNPARAADVTSRSIDKTPKGDTGPSAAR
jgi:hydroxymethylpyrimidine pyrophosphatase-like HAD family hydrolase